MALSYTGVQLEIREISLKNRPIELYEASKKGTVPVLITLDDEVIDESLDIMLWALKGDPKQTWFIEDGVQDLNLIKENDFLFKKWLDRYKYHDRYPDNSKEFYRKKCDNILMNYESQLQSTKYFLKNSLSLSDIAIFPFVRQFANVDYDWFKSKYDKLLLWLERICASDLFIVAMKKYDEWEKNNKSIIINN